MLEPILFLVLVLDTDTRCSGSCFGYRYVQWASESACWKRANQLNASLPHKVGKVGGDYYVCL